MTSELQLLEDLTRSLEADLAKGAVDRALNRITSLGELVYGDPGAIAEVTGSATLDTWCLRIGAAITGDIRQPSDTPSGVLYIATELAYPGGHSYVLRDLIRARPDTRHTVVLSASLGPVDGAMARRFLGPGVDVVVNPDPGPAATVRWLHEMFVRHAPQRIIHLGHPYDAPTIAALQPGVAPEILVFGHVDHAFSLGRYLPHATLATFRSAGYRQATQVDGIEAVAYLPLTAGSPPGRKTEWQTPLTTAASGYWGKFAAPYHYRYWLEVPKWLAATGGRHVHIGRLHPKIHGAITSGMAAEGIEPDRFIYVPSTDSLAAELLAQDVDVYVDSFPLAGCRSVLEAMSVGIPVICHHNADSELLSNETLVYPGAMSWRESADLEEHLRTVGASDLQKESETAARFYLDHHGPEVFAAAVTQPLGSLPDPELRLYRRSQLSSYMRRRVGTAAGRASDARRVMTGLGEALEVRHGTEAKSRTKWLSRASKALYQLTFEDPVPKDTTEETRRLGVVTSLIEIEPELLNQDGQLHRGRVSRMLFDMTGTDRTTETATPAS